MGCWIAGRNRNGNPNSGLNSDRAKASASKHGSSMKFGGGAGSAIRYEYPSLDLQVCSLAYENLVALYD